MKGKNIIKITIFELRSVLFEAKYLAYFDCECVLSKVCYIVVVEGTNFFANISLIKSLRSVHGVTVSFLRIWKLIVKRIISGYC